jgi:hypothetical protein
MTEFLENCIGGERDMSPFSFSVGERKIMNHFVVEILFLFGYGPYFRVDDWND